MQHCEIEAHIYMDCDTPTGLSAVLLNALQRLHVHVALQNVGLCVFISVQ